MKDFKELRLRVAALAVYKNVAKSSGVAALIKMLNTETDEECAACWADYYCALAEQNNLENSCEFIKGTAAADENVLAVAAAAGKNISGGLKQTAAAELETLKMLGELSPKDFIVKFATLGAKFMPQWQTGAADFSVDGIISGYKKSGYGVFTKSVAFSYNIIKKALQPIAAVSGVRLTDLKEYGDEKAEILDNTVSFIKGLPANNVLLYGDRGTGKSSTVHAVLNELSAEGLRLVEVSKAAIPHFPHLLATLAQINFKFIIFIDDLTFIEGADDYACLKAALEGSVGYKADNVLIYATTNRRHLLKESAADRKGDDMHVGDTMQEQLSLSDRFGLVVTFINPDKREFLHILTQILADRGLTVDPRRLELEAERYALNKGGRSPRAAKQLADMIQSKIARGIY